RVEGLEERVEEGFETVDDLARAYESLTENLRETERELDVQKAEVEALQEEVDELRDELDALRGLFSDRVLDKEDAHVGAQKRDASEIVEIGDTRTVVIDGTDYEDSRDPNAVAHIEGLVTFVSAPTEDLTEGD